MPLPANKNRLEGRFRYWLNDDLTAPLGMRISDQVQSSRLRRQYVVFYELLILWVVRPPLLQIFCFTAECAEIAEKFI